MSLPVYSVWLTFFLSTKTVVLFTGLLKRTAKYTFWYFAQPVEKR